MNILWITNIPFGKLRNLLGQSGENTSGSWLNAALDGFIGDSNYKITVVTTAQVKTILTLEEDNIVYCVLPGGYPSEYDYQSDANRKNWAFIKDKYQPDIIQVWGTEYTHGYLALQVFDKTPSVLYMQGLLESISRYYLAGMTTKELRKSITLRDIIKRDWITKRQATYWKQSLIESDMIKMSKNVISENLWCAAHCRAIEPECVVHYSKLNIKDVFFKTNWTKESVEPFTIMSNAAGYPIKGLHILIKALKIVVRRYPSVKLLIPGEDSPFEQNWKKRLLVNGYTKFIKSLILEYGLIDNIKFLGRLNSDEMAHYMSKSNVFVVPSSIENHSSTLIEAMAVGAPCIASNVGGIPEYLTHNENGLMYRFEEHELLAEYICSMFSDINFSEKMGKNARAAILESRNSVNLKENISNIYKAILKPA
jgi:L-malate glycosyltransferase